MVHVRATPSRQRAGAAPPSQGKQARWLGPRRSRVPSGAAPAQLALMDASASGENTTPVEPAGTSTPAAAPPLDCRTYCVSAACMSAGIVTRVPLSALAAILASAACRAVGMVTSSLFFTTSSGLCSMPNSRDIAEEDAADDDDAGDAPAGTARMPGISATAPVAVASTGLTTILGAGLALTAVAAGAAAGLGRGEDGRGDAPDGTCLTDAADTACGMGLASISAAAGRLAGRGLATDAPALAASGTGLPGRGTGDGKVSFAVVGDAPSSNQMASAEGALARAAGDGTAAGLARAAAGAGATAAAGLSPGSVKAEVPAYMVIV
jgi:hypothetical protein